MSTIIVNEVGSGKFEACLDGRVLCVSRQPFLDSARILIAEGHDPDSMLQMGRPNGTIALTAKLGRAAKLAVDESRTRFRSFKAFQNGSIRGDGQAPMRQNGSEAAE